MSISQAVDQRIVEMKFNNADFEQKISKTLESLTKLRESSKMEDAGKGMENLSKGVKNVDINSLAASVEALNGKFSALGIVGMTVMQDLTRAAMNMGKQVVDAITMAPKDGWKEFELNTDSIKTILNSAKDADGLPVTLDLVNEQLNKLNKYSDQTIYSFSDMTSNIGKFTNAGVDLESAVTAIQGVANVAALAGANANDASRAMYNFGQALGSGSVKLIDWKSIENANMATQGFKEQLLQTAVELKTVRKEGDKYVSTTKNMQGKVSDAFTATQGFNDSLAHQWMTAEVLTKTLEKYTKAGTPLGDAAIEAATKVNTLTKLLDTLKESMGSGWMQTWQTLVGDYDEATELWTGIYNELDGIIQKVSGFRNDLLQAWKDLGGRNDLIEGFKNLWKAAQEFVKPIRGLFENLLPPITAEGLAVITRDFREFTARLVPIKQAVEDVNEEVKKSVEVVEDVTEKAEKFKQITQEILEGKWGNGQERIDRLTAEGYAYENLQNAVNETLHCEKRYETVMSDNEAVGEKVAETVQDQANAQVDFKEAIKESNDQLFVHKSAVENLAFVVLGVSSAAKLAVAVVNKGVESFKKLSGGIHPVTAALGLFLDILGNIGRHMYTLNTWLIQFDSLSAALSGIRAKWKSALDIFKNFGIDVTQVGQIQILLTNIGTGFDKVKGKVIDFVDKLKEIGNADGLTNIRNKLMVIGKYIGGALILAFNAVARVINTATDNAKKLWDVFSNLTVIKAVIDLYGQAKDAITGFWQSLTNTVEGNTAYSSAIKELGGALKFLTDIIGGAFSTAFGWLLSALNNLEKATKTAIDAFNLNGVFDNITKAGQEFGAVFKELPDIMTKFFDTLKTGRLPTLTELSENLSNFINTIKGLKTGLETSFTSMFGSFIDNIMSGVNALMQFSLPDQLKGIFEKIKSAFNFFAGITTDAGQTVGDFAKNVIDKLKKFDFKSLAIGGLITSIALFVFRWSKVGKNAAKSISALTTFIKNGGKAATSAADKFSGFLKIAAAIALIAGSIWLLSKVPADRFLACAITLGVAFAALAGAVAYLTREKMDGDKLKAVGIAFAGIGASMLLLAAATKMFAKMELTEIVKGLVIVGAAIAGMVAAIKFTGDVSDGAGAAFAGLAAGVLILAVAVKAFASMKPTTLFKGGAAVTYFVFVMAAAMKLAGDVSADGFVGLAAAVLILTVAVRAIAGMKTAALVKGEVGVIALVAAIALASKSAQNVDGDAFKSMAQAIKILTAAMFILAKIPTLQLIAVTASLILIFKSLTKSANELKQVDYKESGQIAVAMLAMLVPIGAVLFLLSNFTDPDSVLKIALGISAILFAFSKTGPAITSLSKIPWQEGVQAAVNMEIFIGAVALALAALGALDQYTSAGDMITQGAELLGRTIHEFLEALVFGDTDPSAVLKSIGDSLNKFGDKIGTFIDAITGMDPSVATNAKALATAILAICGAEVLEAIAGWIGGKSSIDSFGTAIDGIVSAVLKISNSVSGDKFDNRKVKQVVSAVKSLVEIAQALPKQGGLWQRLTGSQDLGNFASQLATFVNGGFMEFVNAITKVGNGISANLTAKCLIIKTATKALVDIANDLPTSGTSLKSLIFGNQDLGDFASKMAKFMNGGFLDFVNAVNTMPSFNPAIISSQIIPATEGMLKLAQKIQDNSSLFSLITGNSQLSSFGTTLAAFGAGVATFSDSIAGIQTPSIDAVTASVTKLAELNASELIAADQLTMFSTSIIALGTALAAFVESSSAASPEALTTVIDKLTQLHNLLLIMAASDYAGVSGFVSALEKLAAAAVTSFLEEFSVKASAAVDAAKQLIVFLSKGIEIADDNFIKMGTTTAMSFLIMFGVVAIVKGREAGAELIKSIIAGVDNNVKDLKTKGGSVVLKFCEGISSNMGFLTGAGKSMVKHAIDGINEDIGDFYNKGEDAAEGFSHGIRDSAWRAAEEAARMVRDAINAAKNEQQSASPSKVFRQLGTYGGEGYALGFVDTLHTVTSSVRQVGHAGILAMKDTIVKMNSMIDDEMGDGPTITPVMDLSQLTSGINNTKGLLSELNGVTTDVRAAMDISSAHNESLMRKKQATNRDYTSLLDQLLENTRIINETAKQNKVAVIDGDYLFGYVDTRMGMA